MLQIIAVVVETALLSHSDTPICTVTDDFMTGIGIATGIGIGIGNVIFNVGKPVARRLLFQAPTIHICNINTHTVNQSMIRCYLFSGQCLLSGGAVTGNCCHGLGSNLGHPNITASWILCFSSRPQHTRCGIATISSSIASVAKMECCTSKLHYAVVAWLRISNALAVK